MCSETETLATVEVMPETMTGEETPKGLPSGIAYWRLLSNRTGEAIPLPVLTLNVAVRVFWSDLINNTKSIVAPQGKLGDVLILNGTTLVARPRAPISGYPEMRCAIVTPGVFVERVAETPVAGVKDLFTSTILNSSHSLGS